jgi:hypothetical protein
VENKGETMKEITVSDKQGFRLKLRQWKCISPEQLNSLEFIQEHINDKGEITNTSTYNFFMNDNEIKSLAESLLK